MGAGIPSVEIPAILLKIKVNVTTVKTGAKKNQRGPRMVCL